MSSAKKKKMQNPEIVALLDSSHVNMLVVSDFLFMQLVFN